MELAASRIRAIRGSNINTFTQRVALPNSALIVGNGFNDVVIDVATIFINPATNTLARVIIGAVGNCANLTPNGNFTEVEVAFTAGRTWTGTPGNQQGITRYTGSVFGHELGHAVGVAHEDTSVLAIMNAVIGGFLPGNNNSRGTVVLGGPSLNEQGSPAFHGQDVLAVRQIYPDSSTGINAYVSKWRRGPGPFGQLNNPTNPQSNRLLSSTGATINVNGGRIFSGQGYRLQYTAGNTSTSARNVTVNMRISSPNNQNIHFGNQIIASRTHFLQPGQNVESQINFTMPNVQNNQNYYFGYTVQIPGDNDAADNRTILFGRFRG